MSGRAIVRSISIEDAFIAAGKGDMFLSVPNIHSSTVSPPSQPNTMVLFHSKNSPHDRTRIPRSLSSSLGPSGAVEIAIRQAMYSDSERRLWIAGGLSSERT